MESVRLERYKHNLRADVDSVDTYSEEFDQIISNAIQCLLEHSDITEENMVDAFYYDFSILPQEQRDIGRDKYLLFGITHSGEIISKWVERDTLELLITKKRK